MSLAQFAFYGALVAIVLVCAAHVPKEQRGAAVLAAGIFAANWLIYVSAWTYTLTGHDISAWALANSLGIKVSDEAIWAYADALAATAIVLTCYKNWWGFAIWALYTLQIYVHYERSFAATDFGFYAYSLDLLFMAMVAVFILIGGKGVSDHVYRIVGDLHVRGLRGLRGALQRAEAGKVDEP